MAPPHLAKGSEMPPKYDDKWRLYSMEYCPYAHRTRLVLNVKKIPYEVVNINLVNKPEWYFSVHPDGKVPALDTGTQVIVESLDICDYVNDKFPDPPLYPDEPIEKEAQREIIHKIDALTSKFSRLIREQEQKSGAEWLSDFAPHLDYFEKVLENVGGTYFGGDVPNMVDYMLWPWAERVGVIPMILKEKLPLQPTDFRRLRDWRNMMRTRPEVDDIYTGPAKYRQVILFITQGLTPDFDGLANL